MNAILKGAFASVVGVLFAVGVAGVLLGAHGTVGYTPNSGQQFLLDTVGGALIAFLAAQLGISSSLSNGDGAMSLREGISKAMGAKSSSSFGVWLLAADGLIFIVAGLLFVWFWIQPSLFAVAHGSAALKDAPAYVQTQAKAFVGITLAALAALGPAAK